MYVYMYMYIYIYLTFIVARIIPQVPIKSGSLGNHFKKHAKQSQNLNDNIFHS